MTPDNENHNNHNITTSLPHRPRISPTTTTTTDENMSQSRQGPPSPRSPHSPSLSSLQAAATLNAGLRSSTAASVSGTPVKNSIERRRSSLLTNFALNDPTIPAPGEMQQTHSARSGRRSSVVSPTIGGDPHHHRQPSIGEMYQDMEIETEGQVNRLLHMIRLQQDQLAALQNQNNQNHDSSAIAPTPPAGSSRPSSAHPHDSQLQHPQPTTGASASTNANSRSTSFSSAVPVQAGLPHGHGIFNRPHSLSRQSSARISNNASGTTSPALHPSSGLGPLTEDFLLGGTRDDAAFYQAETVNLTRENQLLKFRIRELG
jgi:hypothetical protein